MLKFHAASHASRGARRYQEDSAAMWPSSDPSTGGGAPLIAVLADGMGGHAGGAIASRTACDAFISAIRTGGDTNRERLRAALDAANAAIANHVANNPSLRGMGCTLVGAIFGENGLEWVSVGDSPLYLFRNGEIALLNEDHSLAPALDQLAAEGRLTISQARSDPRRHLLRSAVTGEDLDLVDLSRQPLPLQPGDCVLLASDGIQTLEPDQIARTISKHLTAGPEAIAEALISAVENVGDPHQDNVTVLLVNPVEAREAVG